MHAFPESGDLLACMPFPSRVLIHSIKYHENIRTWQSPSSANLKSVTTSEKQISYAILTYGLYAQETGTKTHIYLESLHRGPNKNNRVCPLEHL